MVCSFYVNVFVCTHVALPHGVILDGVNIDYYWPDYFDLQGLRVLSVLYICFPSFNWISQVWGLYSMWLYLTAVRF